MTPPLPFSTVSKHVSSVSASLSFVTACRSSSYVSALSQKSLSDSTKVCDGTVCSSNIYHSKPICPSKHVYLSNACRSKPIISSNFSLSKPPSNIYPNKPVSLSNICLNKPACATTVSK